MNNFRNNWFLGLFFVVGLLGCSRTNQAPAPESSDLAPAAERELPKLQIPDPAPLLETGLVPAADQPVPGFLLPDGLELTERQGLNRTYRTQTSIESLVGFYQGQGFVVERHPEGATVTRQGHPGKLNLVRSGHKWNYLIFLLQSREEETTAEVPESTPPKEEMRSLHEAVKQSVKSGDAKVKVHLPSDFPQ